MKVDTSKMRYLSPDDWKVLESVEIGSKNYEIVPTAVIQLGSRVNPGASGRCMANLAKNNLITKVRNAKYDGYRLTYSGHDYLAFKSMVNRGTMAGIGTTVGVGKESDIYLAMDSNKVEKILKIHRLGRTSFRAVKSKRDYLKKNTGGSWMYLSKVAAGKEYQFLSMLHQHNFKVPKPYDYSRHCILMEKIKGDPMTKLYLCDNYKKLYSDLMCFIVQLASYGLIHCDFNEFNIMANNEGEFVVLDFPQSISVDHLDAEEYFNRDVECIRRFFKRRFNYLPKKDVLMLDDSGYGNGYKHAFPELKRDVNRVEKLDEILMASGYKKRTTGRDSEFEDAMKKIREQDIQEEVEDEDDDGSQDESESESEYESEYESEEENEKIIKALQIGDENLKVDKLGNYILE